jgi:hypothetical protein
VPDDAQLSFLDAPRTVLRWHPRVSPPDSIGPFDRAYEAALAQCPGLCGWGRCEDAAIEALGDRLRTLVDQRAAVGGLTAVGQALAAAQRLDRDQLGRWLSDRAEELVLAEDRGL